MVFPGGRVDPGDHALVPADAPRPGGNRRPHRRDPGDDRGSGLGHRPVALPRHCDADPRARNHGGGTILCRALADHGLTLDTQALTPFARWCPEHVPVRRFDARFYLAAIARAASNPNDRRFGNGRGHVDDRPRRAGGSGRGAIRIILPTRRTLERLALYRDFASAAADARPGRSDGSSLFRRSVTAWLVSASPTIWVIRSRRNPSPARDAADAALRRWTTALVVVAGLAMLALLLWGWARRNPQDVPWAPLDLGQPVGCSPGAS